MRVDDAYDCDISNERNRDITLLDALHYYMHTCITLNALHYCVRSRIRAWSSVYTRACTHVHTHVSYSSSGLAWHYIHHITTDIVVLLTVHYYTRCTITLSDFCVSPSCWSPVHTSYYYPNHISTHIIVLQYITTHTARFHIRISACVPPPPAQYYTTYTYIISLHTSYYYIQYMTTHIKYLYTSSSSSVLSTLKRMTRQKVGGGRLWLNTARLNIYTHCSITHTQISVSLTPPQVQYDATYITAWVVVLHTVNYYTHCTVTHSDICVSRSFSSPVWHYIYHITTHIIYYYIHHIATHTALLHTRISMSLPPPLAR